MDKNNFLLTERISQIESSFLKEGWLTIFENNHSKNEDDLIFCCIVDSKRIKEYKLKSEWVIRPGSEGKPSIFETYVKDKLKITYKTNSDDGIEPFLFSKHFKINDSEDSYIDVSEEFILYFKLYEKIIDKQNRIFYFIDEVGDLEEVIKIEPNIVKVKLKYLKEYISVRKVYFSICFDFMRLYNNNLSSMNINHMDKNFQTDKYFYNHLIRPSNTDVRNQSWIMGKVIINFDKNKAKGYISDYENKIYEKFITGYDSDGNEILQDCKRENKKYFILTYFKKEVLNKYYNNPKKYSVDGWYVNSPFFSLKIDNNIEEYVPVFLVELGSLPYKEQLHWKQYNIPPQKGISNTYYETMIEGNWVENPEAIDLFFKHKYEQFNKDWELKFGWKFYKPFEKQDKYIFDSLHLPSSNNVKTFCEQMLSIVKITIDKLNESGLSKNIILEKNDKGITKLEKFLKSNTIDLPVMILFLRNLWFLRSGLLAHSFSDSNKDCKKAIEYFGIKGDNYIDVAKNIFLKSIYTLNTLEKKFLK